MDGLFDMDLRWQIDGLAVSIDELVVGKNDTNEWLKSASHKITLGAKRIFDVFFKANNVQPSEMPQYYCSPYWCDATSNFKWRFMIVSTDNDYFLVFLRLVGIMYHQQYFSISYNVLSLKGFKHAAWMVRETIKTMNVVKSVETVYDGTIEDCTNVNYYCDRENVGVMNKNRRNKYRRALALRDSGLTVRRFSLKEKKEALADTSALYDVFQSGRFGFNRRSADKLLVTALNDASSHVYGFYYNNVLVGVQMATNDFLRCVYIHFAKDITALDVETIAKYVGCDVTMAQRLKNFLGTFEEEYVKEDILVNKHYDALFVDGFIADNPDPMIMHKRGFYPKQVFYKIEKL